MYQEGGLNTYSGTHYAKSSYRYGITTNPRNLVAVAGTIYRAEPDGW